MGRGKMTWRPKALERARCSCMRCFGSNSRAVMVTAAVVVFFVCFPTVSSESVVYQQVIGKRLFSRFENSAVKITPSPVQRKHISEIRSGTVSRSFDSTYNVFCTAPVRILPWNSFRVRCGEIAKHFRSFAPQVKFTVGSTARLRKKHSTRPYPSKEQGPNIPRIMGTSL